MSWTLDNEENRFEIPNAEKLRQYLHEFHQHAQQKPVIVTLNAPDKSCLAIGLGRDLSVLNYIAPGGWPALHVVGDEANDGVIDYMCFGQFSQIPARNTIPIDRAIEAAVEFFNSGKLAEALQWEND